MVTPNVLAFEPDGRPIEFTVWLDDLQLFLLTDAKEGVSLFDYLFGTAVTPADDAPALERSQWQTRDAAARLAIRNHLPITERAHFSQHRTAKTLYDAVVARYSSPATAAIGRLMLPYLFPDLSSFTTAEDLVSHLRATDSRFRAALSAEDHFLALDPTTLTVDDFEKHLLAAEKNILSVGAARGTPRSPLFEGCSPSPLTPSYTSAAAAHDYLGAEGVGAASAPSGKRRSGRGGRGGRGGGGGGGGGGGAGEVEVVGVVVGVEAVEVVVGAAEALGAVEGAAAGVGEEGAVVALVVRASSSRSSSSSSSSISVSARPPLPSNFLT
ncbi:unnamed protein product, partial [Closterium sp. NIES-54]